MFSILDDSVPFLFYMTNYHLKKDQFSPILVLESLYHVYIHFLFVDSSFVVFLPNKKWLLRRIAIIRPRNIAIPVLITIYL